MKWVNKFGREIEWNTGEPWPSELPEETEARIPQYKIQQQGGYYCRDGDHFTFSSFSFPGCCTWCDIAVNEYYDSQIWH